jgi:hypothetical protein
MKTKHRTAAKARRKWQADPSVIYRVMGKHQDFTTQEKGQIVDPCRKAFDRIRSGDGKANDFIILSDASNVSLVRAEKINPLVESVCLVARDALLRCKSRFYKTGRWGFDGPAISAITDMLDVYEQMVDLLKPHQIQDDLAEAMRRERDGDGLNHPECELEAA